MNSYLKAAYAKIQKRNKKISMMVADNFMGAKYWAPFWNKGDNIVFDSHFCERYPCDLPSPGIKN